MDDRATDEADEEREDEMGKLRPLLEVAISPLLAELEKRSPIVVNRGVVEAECASTFPESNLNSTIKEKN